MGAVVTHEKFGGAEHLRSLGVKVDNILTSAQVAEMKLPEPGYGEATVGTCTDEEALLFHALFTMQGELEDVTRKMIGASLTKMGTTIRDSDRNQSIHDVVKDGDMKLSFDTETQAEKYFAMQQRVTHLHALFYHTIGERLAQHRNHLGVRSRMRIVTFEKRY